VEGLLDELHEFHTLFQDCFVRREPREHLFRYMVGQFSTLERKSIEPIAVQTEASSIRAMQRGISDAQWQDERMLQKGSVSKVEMAIFTPPVQRHID
jgi:DDE superfamily endonuclease